MTCKGFVLLVAACTLVIAGRSQSGRQQPTIDSLDKEKSVQALAASSLCGYFNLKRDYLTGRTPDFAGDQAAESAPNGAGREAVEGFIKQLVQATVDSWTFTPEIGSGPAALSLAAKPVGDPSSGAQFWIFICSLVASLCIAAVLACGAYQTFQGATFNYKPSNPVSVLLFLSASLFSAVWWMADWLVIRCRTLANALYTSTSNRLQHVSRADAVKMPDDNLTPSVHVS